MDNRYDECAKQSTSNAPRGWKELTPIEKLETTKLELVKRIEVIDTAIKALKSKSGMDVYDVLKEVNMINY